MNNYEVPMQSGETYFVQAPTMQDARNEAERLALAVHGQVDVAVVSVAHGWTA